MSVGLVTLKDANIQRVLEDPPLVWQVIAPGDPQAYEFAREQEYRRTPLFRVFGRERSPGGGVPDLEMAADEGLSTDLDQAWHGIHYLLTGTAWEGDLPRGFLVSGGTPAGHLDAAYGPARVLTATETRAVYDVLQALSHEELQARFDPEDMLAKQIYPGRIWAQKAEEEDTFRYLLQYLGRLRSFLERAVDSNVGLVIYVS